MDSSLSNNRPCLEINGIRANDHVGIRGRPTYSVCMIERPTAFCELKERPILTSMVVHNEQHDRHPYHGNNNGKSPQRLPTKRQISER